MRGPLLTRVGASVWICAAAALMPVCRAGASPLFHGLGDLDGGDVYSEAKGVSANGSVIVGTSSSASGTEAFRWTAADGMVGLGGLSKSEFGSWANGVSGNGRVVVGYSIMDDFSYQGFRWCKKIGLVGMPDFNAEHVQSTSNAASYDGHIIVGQANCPAGDRAFLWDSGTMINLGNIDDSKPNSSASAVTPDGSVVVGFGYNSGDKPEAFRWTKKTGMLGLNEFPGGKDGSSAYGVSADGSVIVGYGTSSSGSVPVRWTSQDEWKDRGEMQPLGPYSVTGNGEARAISGDGSIIVGKTDLLGAFIWDRSHGIRSLKSVLTDDFGLTDDLANWELDVACAISTDGRTIVGTGRHPDGSTEAWYAVVPEPCGPCLLAIPLVLLSSRRRTRGV